MPTPLTANLRQGEMQFLKLYGPTEGNCLLMLNICDFCTAISRNPLQRTQIYNLFFLDVIPINLEGWQLYDWVKKNNFGLCCGPVNKGIAQRPWIWLLVIAKWTYLYSRSSSVTTSLGTLGQRKTSYQDATWFLILSGLDRSLHIWSLLCSVFLYWLRQCGCYFFIWLVIFYGSYLN